MRASDLITVVIPSSVIPSHPETFVVEGAIRSIRKHLPNVSIVIESDGLKGDEAGSARYHGYNVNLILLQSLYGNIRINTFASHTHQTNMLRSTIEDIHTPLLMYLEHDWFILDLPIDFDGIAQALIAGDVNSVRLHRWDTIVPEHEHLMRGEFISCGAPLVRTLQWSQHPHVASVDFYKRMLSLFPSDATWIEHAAYGFPINGNWEEYRLALYNPEKMKRIEHMDGREFDPTAKREHWHLLR